MIDAGADFTVIQPSVATQVLRSESERLPTIESDIVHVFGVGQGSVRTRVHTLGLSLRDDLGQRFWFTSPVLLVDALDAGNGSTKWDLPSLLGRDVLRRFDFHLSYDPPSVTLTLND